MHGLENLVVTGRIEARRARGCQRMKYLDRPNLCRSWKDNASRAQHGSSGLQKTESSGITWSVMALRLNNNNNNNNNNIETWGPMMYNTS